MYIICTESRVQVTICSWALIVPLILTLVSEPRSVLGSIPVGSGLILLRLFPIISGEGPYESVRLSERGKEYKACIVRYSYVVRLTNAFWDVFRDGDVRKRHFVDRERRLLETSVRVTRCFASAV